MLLRLANPATRLSLVAVAFLLAGALSFLSIRNALAAHDVDLNTRAGYENAVRLEPSDFENWYLLGRYWEYTVAEESDPSRAIQAYRAALALNPLSSDTWLDLATLYEADGRLSDAHNAFLEAKRAYPLSAEVSWRYGNFLLRQGEVAEAFTEIHRAVSVDPQRSAEAFSLCWRVNLDVRAILDNVLPPDPTGYLSVIRELAAKNQLDPALLVWDRLVSLQPSHLSLLEPTLLTNALLQSHRLDDAVRVWRDAIRLSDLPPTGDPPNSAVWDGGFETGIAGGFGWSFSSIPRGANARVDTGEAHSGQRSLRLDFDGNHNVRFDSVCETTILRPATSYVFSAWVKTRRLTTDQGIRFRLAWLEKASEVILETQDIRGTEPWTRIQMPWTSPSGVRQVRVCVVRDTSGKVDGQIQGTAWVDDVSLVPQTTPQAPL